MMDALYDWTWVIVVVLIALFVVGMILARLYRRATKERAFVRTGKGGQKVVKDGGALVIPILHDTILVNMTTVRIDVHRAAVDALITKDRMRVDVKAEFFLRVAPREESIAIAAQTLGLKTLKPLDLSQLVTGKFVDALRAVAAGMIMEDLHEKRSDFVQKVQNVLEVDLGKNGLELESVSLTGLDQTDKKYFNPDNVFDAQGLLKLTEQVEQRRKERNEVVRTTEIAVQSRNLEAEQASLMLRRESEFAQMGQEREIAERRADQKAQIAMKEAENERESKRSRIMADQQVRESEIGADQSVEARKIATERELEESRIQKDQTLKMARIGEQRAVETATIEKGQAVDIAEQDRQIAIANKSKEHSESAKQADMARADAVRASEAVITARQTAEADRAKQVELIEAAKRAEREAIGITVAAEAEKKAVEDQAESVRIKAQGDANASRIEAEAQRDAMLAQAAGKAEMYRVEAEGKAALNAADNSMSPAVIAYKVQLETIQALPGIIEQSVKPMERIESIKVIHAEGLIGGSGRAMDEGTSGQDLTSQITAGALRYQAQAPLLHALMEGVGIKASGFPIFQTGTTSASPSSVTEETK